MKNIVVLVFAFMLGVVCHAQMTVYGGIIYLKSPDLQMTPSNFNHSGYTIGANLRMLDDGMCFLFTGEYGQFNLLARDKFDFTWINKDITFIRGKAGLGFDVLKLNKKAKLRTKFQGNVLYIYKYKPENVGSTPAMRENGYSELNEAIGGLSTGAGITYGILDLDFEYEYGFFNLYHTIKSTKMDIVTLTAGVRF